MFVCLTAFLLTAPLFAAQDKPAGYAGSDTCQPCHEDVFKAFQKNPHHSVESDKKRGWDTRACESCHGPGAKHAETTSAADIINPFKQAPAKADQNCLKCHLNQPTQVGRLHGGHVKNQVACVSCHSIHKGQEKLVSRRAENVNQLCSGCHAPVWAQFQRPYKHMLPQGAMSCVDCHNPHGSLLPGMVRTVSANEPGCFKCHANLRGPYTFEHAPMRLGNCTQCHEPHGSANPRMLVRHEVRFLCLECHSNTVTQKTLGSVPPGFHDLRNPRFQNCTTCHNKIHGSYVDKGLTR